MKDEYIIINKTVIQQRIDELDKEVEPIKISDNITKSKHPVIMDSAYKRELSTLKQILSQSTPLIPEIEKAFDAGKAAYLIDHYIHASTSFEDAKQQYISNLKLDI